MAGDVDGGGDLGVEGGVAVAVAPDHLADADPLRVPHQGGGDGPALEGGFDLLFRDGVEVVVDPDGVDVRLGFGGFGHGRHGLVLFNRVVDLDQIEFPTLRDEDAEFRCTRHDIPLLGRAVPANAAGSETRACCCNLRSSGYAP